MVVIDIRTRETITPRMDFVAAACGEMPEHRVESEDGTIRYYQFEGGSLHREDGPAVENPRTGRREYWEFGQRHRLLQPAIIDGPDRYWYFGDKLHRCDGPAVEKRSAGVTEYWLNGERHREDGPAVVKPDQQEFWCHGLLHRTDGPAVITPTGCHWYRNGFSSEPRVEQPELLAA
jgi:hypothetical protein